MGQEGCEEGDGESGIETLLRESKSLSSRILEKWFRWYIFLKVINSRSVLMSTIYTDAINQQSNYGERVVKGVSFRLTVKKLYYQPDIGSSKPTLPTQYPRAHKWRPQKHFPRSTSRVFRSARKDEWKVCPFKQPIRLLTEYFDGIERTTCTWSAWTFNSKYLHQLLLSTKTINLLTRIFSDRILEYPIVIFRTKHNMILAFIDRIW